MRNLQEGRGDLARHVFHGRKGELRRAYREGQENQLDALGLVLNCVTLWNAVYLDHALAVLREQGYPVLDSDAARLSAYMRRHINGHGHGHGHGHYSFTLPTSAGFDGRCATPTVKATTRSRRSAVRRCRVSASWLPVAVVGRQCAGGAIGCTAMVAGGGRVRARGGGIWRGRVVRPRGAGGRGPLGQRAGCVLEPDGAGGRVVERMVGASSGDGSDGPGSAG